MTANVYFDTIVPNADTWTPLSATRMIMDATIIIWRQGATTMPLQMCIDNEDPHDLIGDIAYNVSFPLRNVDLSKIKFKGESNFRVSVVGYTV